MDNRATRMREQVANLLRKEEAAIICVIYEKSAKNLDWLEVE